MKQKSLALIFLFLLAIALNLLAEEKDAERIAFENDKLKAEKGDAKAQCALAEFYALGQGVAKDMAEAVKWFRRSADQGEAEAQDGRGVCYRDGHGVTKDPVEAVKWFRKAAEQGFSEAE